MFFHNRRRYQKFLRFSGENLHLYKRSLAFRKYLSVFAKGIVQQYIKQSMKWLNILYRECVYPTNFNKMLLNNGSSSKSTWRVCPFSTLRISFCILVSLDKPHAKSTIESSRISLRGLGSSCFLPRNVEAARFSSTGPIPDFSIRIPPVFLTHLFCR